MSKKKKIVILTCMVALLAVTAIFNFILTTTPFSDNDSAVVNASSYFAQYRSERMTTRNEELLQLDEVIANAQADSVEKNQALSMKMELTAITEQELLLENLIKAYGFEEVVVVIGMESDNVNVITKSDNLTSDDAILIYSIIDEEISVSPENVKIIPIS